MYYVISVLFYVCILLYEAKTICEGCSYSVISDAFPIYKYIHRLILLYLLQVMKVVSDLKFPQYFWQS